MSIFVGLLKSTNTTNTTNTDNTETKLSHKAEIIVIAKNTIQQKILTKLNFILRFFSANDIYKYQLTYIEKKTHILTKIFTSEFVWFCTVKQ